MLSTTRLALALAFGLAIAAIPLAAGAQEAPAAFKQCAACHKVEAGKNLIGPSLAGIIGRKAGTAAGFTYSPAMVAWGQTWDEAALSKYLVNTKEFIPGNKMAFNGVKSPEDIAAIVAYLKTVK